MQVRTSTVGCTMEHLETKIIDPKGNVVPIGEQGEICVRGYSVMHGYWEDEANTRQVRVFFLVLCDLISSTFCERVHKSTSYTITVHLYVAIVVQWLDKLFVWQVIGADRFYRTGDLGIMDKNGNLRVVGRLKDLIVRGGSKVFPAEVEQVHYNALRINCILEFFFLVKWEKQSGHLFYSV